jgi:hypothetical protein
MPIEKNQAIDRTLIQQYVNNFRRRFSRWLKPGIGLSCRILTAKFDGAIVEFTVGKGIRNEDNYEKAYPTLADALSTIKQRAFGGNLKGYVFKGTNAIVEPKRIVFIKDYSAEEWSDEAADRDVGNVLRRGHGGRP